ncbi:MAG: hypothetical protein Q8O66_02180 [bacterium]|nr:hypothetical protein [bacterium]
MKFYFTEEILKKVIKNIKGQKKNTLIIFAVSVFAVISVGVFVFYLLGKDNSVASTNTEAGENDAVVVTVGERGFLNAGNATSNNSWPGEIISLNNLQVQPAREGTISEWSVHIGERIFAGQTIGKLSRPPQMPDVIMSLSEKQQMMSEAETNAEALRAYTAKRINELKQLRMDTENSNKDKLDLLAPDSSGPDDTSLSLISSKIKMAQAILRGSIIKIFPMIYGQNNVPPLELILSIRLKPMFGVINSSLRNKFPDIIYRALSDLQDTKTVPEKSGLLYFDTAIKLAGSSVADGDVITDANLESIKEMLVEDQSMFITTIGEIKSMQLEKVNTQRESIDTLAEIDEKIADLNKELAMAEGDLVAKKEAYATMSGAISGGYLITAPTSGIVSSIMKKPGEFVGPGMAMAIVTADNKGDILVRIKIPNNIQKPKIGDILSVVRPGFETNIQKAKLVGVGSSLDEDGSYMADAIFEKENNWSIGSSVRVLEPASSSSILAKYSAVVWDKDGVPSIWAVSEADRIYKKDITIGRTLGDSVEVYFGLLNGDRYINNPTPDIKEDMFLDEIIKIVAPEKSDGDGGMHM